MIPRKTLILGAGPAGLAAGYYLSQSGHAVSLLEASADVGGYARTLTHGPFRYDTGAHRFHDKDAEITRDVLALMGDELLKVHAPSQICWNGKFLDFPLSPANLASQLGPLNLVRAAADMVRARLAAPHGEPQSFAEHAYHRYGKTIADAFLIGYSQKLWGVPADRLAPQVSGGRLKGLRARTMLYELLRGKREQSEHLDGSFYYPRGGYGKIAERLAREIGDEHLRTSCRITKLHHDTARITEVELEHGERLTAERIVSTLPPTVLLSLLTPAPPPNILARAASLRFRDLILVALMLDRPRVSRNASIYFPSPDLPFTRLYEPKNRSLELAPPKQTCIVVELPCFTEDERWSTSDERLAQTVAGELERVKLIRQSEVIESRVHRLRAAYPVLELGCESVGNELRDYLSRFVNLYVIGRAGRFEYTHVHDLLRQGKDLAELLKVESQPTLAFDSV